MVVKREAGNGGQEEAGVFGAVGFVDGRGLERGKGWGVSVESELPKDFRLNGELGGVGKLVAVRAEELDAVVLPGIVRGGDDHAGGEPVDVSEVGDGGRGDDAGIFDRGSAGVEGGGERGGDRLRGLAGVHAEEHAWVRGGGFESVREREADGVDGGRVKRGLAGDGANAVGAEELLHAGSFSVSVSVMVARTLPWERRARIRCCGRASAASRRMPGSVLPSGSR